MRRIKPGEAQVGDVIAVPLVNEEGRTLLPQGARLSAAVLSRLSDWGVHELSIEGDTEDVEPTAAAGAADLLAALEHRFSEWEGDATMVRIKGIARRHLGGG